MIRNSLFANQLNRRKRKAKQLESMLLNSLRINEKDPLKLFKKSRKKVYKIKRFKIFDIEFAIKKFSRNRKNFKSSDSSISFFSEFTGLLLKANESENNFFYNFKDSPENLRNLTFSLFCVNSIVGNIKFLKAKDKEKLKKLTKSKFLSYKIFFDENEQQFNDFIKKMIKNKLTDFEIIIFFEILQFVPIKFQENLILNLNFKFGKNGIIALLRYLNFIQNEANKQNGEFIVNINLMNCRFNMESLETAYEVFKNKFENYNYLKFKNIGFEFTEDQINEKITFKLFIFEEENECDTQIYIDLDLQDQNVANCFEIKTKAATFVIFRII